ncbi:uncharacterized protein LOC141717495 [Apium graveolens]|uniref:uncharacterized protein LOC141717495 n=1 Tax=Apium graveolens TaxID=4045 RepID=UPI003D7B7526
MSSSFCSCLSTHFKSTPTFSFPKFQSFSTLISASASKDEIPLRLGFLGLGIMGSPMAQNLIKSGLSAKQIIIVQAVSSVNLDVEVPSSEYKEFSVKSKKEGNKLKISVEVFGARTQKIFDDVFSKMVAAAQPIPGFRRVKGGKTPDIPRNILLEVLGPSKVYKEVIKKVIDSAIFEYVKKEGLTVGKNVSVEQSFEDLEAIFEPGGSFKFDVVVQCQQSP